MKIYVGNVTSNTDEQTIQKAFEQFGAVESVHIPKDPHTGKFKGFALVDMLDDQQAAVAIAELNGFACNGSWWAVKPAR